MSNGGDATPAAGLLRRVWSRPVGAMLARNTVVSTFAFIVGLAVLWALVHLARADKVVSAGVSFITANTLHYALGRSWIFAGTQRALHTGYALFLVNSGIGLAITLALFALMVEGAGVNYLVARVLVSVVAGLVMFLLNATLNFRRV
ncbi:GtrA family protein [Novosphingobium colocasiae]|uniref:GtrA family protein n=1 Tax=Novosphingobium colocasiae TaxID=1256513 RepID=UPI0035B12AEA